MKEWFKMTDNISHLPAPFRPISSENPSHSHFTAGFRSYPNDASQTPPSLRPISNNHSPNAKPTIPPLSSITTPEMNPTSGYFGASPPQSTGDGKRYDYGSLMSPPEPPPLESSRAHILACSGSMQVQTQRDPALPSPISPAIDGDMCIGEALHGAGTRDPILYTETSPAAESSSARSGSVRDRMSIDNLVDHHIFSRPLRMFVRVEPPSREEYRLFANATVRLRSGVYSLYNNDRRGWLKQQRRALEEDRRARLAAAPQTIRPAPQPIRPTANDSEGLHAVRAQPSAPRRSSGPGPARNSQRATPTARPAPYRAGARAERGTKRSSPRPERRQAPVTREDKNFEEVTDYSPSLDTIPSRPDCLKVEWKGNHLNLEHDKFRHLLHPEEVKLASSLRLDCATYLTSKRRIFVKRVECYERNKEFRKTDAQQACNIDVNKASRLHSAYEGIGWLDSKWIMKHVEQRACHRAKIANGPV